MPTRKKYYTKGKPKKKVATVEYVKKAIHKNIENKFDYGSMAVAPFTSIGTSWVEQAFGLVGRGTEVNKRIGNSITVKSIQLEMVLVGGATDNIADDAYNTVRIVLAAWDCETTPLGAASWNMNYPLRSTLCPTTSSMLKKYYDKYITIPSVGAGTIGVTPGMRKVSYYKYFKKGFKMNFADASADYPDKKLILSMISDSQLPPNPGVTNGYWVITYEDA